MMVLASGYSATRLECPIFGDKNDLEQISRFGKAGKENRLREQIWPRWVAE